MPRCDFNKVALLRTPAMGCFLRLPWFNFLNTVKGSITGMLKSELLSVVSNFCPDGKN